jgi:restriction system protein
MARRRRRDTSTAQAIVELIALCPWWVGVAAAVLAYMALHAAASAPPLATAGGAAHISVAAVLVKTLAGFGQYVLPGLFLLGAGLSSLRRPP